MQHSHINPSYQEVEHPLCGRCGAPMWLARIEPAEADHDRRIFECGACAATTTKVVKYQQTSDSE